MHCKGELSKLLLVVTYLVPVGIFVEENSKELHFGTYFICIILMTQWINGPRREVISSTLQHDRPQGSADVLWVFKGHLK